MRAIKHSQQHLQPWASIHAEEFHHVMGSLVFVASDSNPYSYLYAYNQWEKIAELFYQELFRLHSMTQQSLLLIELQVQYLFLPSLLQ